MNGALATSRLRSKRIVLAAVVTTAVAGFMSTSSAEGRTAQSVSFFASGDASGHWDNKESADPDDRFSMKLTVGDATSYAGITLHHVEGRPAPAESPSFDFKADREGASGGSPRLVIQTANGAVLELRPDEWQQDWAHVPADGDWDARGGDCVFLYDQDYDEVRQCTANTPVTAAFVVTDSGWMYLTGYVNWIDNLQYDGKTISAPSDNANSGGAPS